jgi:hypothetical protein
MQVYAGLSIAVVGLTALARGVEPLLFQRFTGATDPVIVAMGISVLGAVLLSVLCMCDGFVIAQRRPAKGLLWSAGLAALFGMVIIAVDFAIVHPTDMNVPLPQSLLFYPVIAFIVEILFHLVPLSLLLMLLPTIVRRVRSETIVWISLFLVSVLEPSFQLLTAVFEVPVIGAPHAYAAWALGYDWLHVLAINLCQLLIFKRYDFISMYAFRFVYYGIWHIAWGHVRLSVLS